LEKLDASAPRLALESTARDQGRGIVRIASLGLVAVLALLSGFAFWGAFWTYRASVAVTNAIALSDAFDQAHHAVLTEESLERKYRLEPSEPVRALYLEAATALQAALQEAKTLGGPHDAALIDVVEALHGPYLMAIRNMFAAIDAGEVAGATRIDGAEVDPSFEAIATRVEEAASNHHAEASRSLQDLRRLHTGLLAATPIVFLLGMSLVFVFWSVMRAQRRQASDAVEREAAGIRRSEVRFRSLLQHASDLVLICTSDGIITYQSPNAETVWRYPANRLLDRPFLSLVHPEDQTALQALLDQLQTDFGTTQSTAARLRDADNTWRHAELILTNLLRTPGVDGLVATIRDITERKAFEAQLTEQALHDALTGLPNRSLFQDRLEQALARAARKRETVGLLYLDIDNFKLINDSLGHQAGDELLIQVAARLRSCVRDGDTVSRFGGDEFVILLGHATDRAEAVMTADRIAEEFALPFNIDGRDFTTTASVGIALGDSAVERADIMLRNADIAMYRAKSIGKGMHVVFDASMHTNTLARMELESGLKLAVERHELRIQYQPIVMLSSGRVVEVEALVRWQHPTRGLLAPADFIPIAEDTPVIMQIGQWVLDQACRQVATWQTEFPSVHPLMVSVNLSPRQFQQPNLVDQVRRALQESGLKPACLTLEITEGVIMRDIEATILKLWALKELGVQLSIDDFGTGYSSLAYLKRLPLDILKIDRSFVSGLGRDKEDTAIVRAIISLAKSLDLAVTGEGIETSEQAELLKSWECERGQGYYFARPLDPTDLTALLGKADTRDRVRAA
jgi:diguanylate cyclase (GGDEF)-like protein/PAS domain S-box-containing protein